MDPYVSIVVIGLNEEKNLDHAFKAIRNQNYPREKIELIYVDSGSRDNSVNIARQYTDKVFIERSAYPTAARGRNRGLMEAQGNIIHFVDADVEIDPDYLKKALSLLENENIHAVTGELVEKNENNNFFSRFFVITWEKNEEGFVESTKSGATYKKELLAKINGYDERIKTGEENELGIRFRQAGYHIYFVNCTMGKHNYSVNSLKDFIRKFVKNGESQSVQMLQRDRSEYYSAVRKYALKNIMQNLYFFLIILLSLKSSIFLLFFFLSFLFLLMRYVIHKKIKNAFHFFFYFFMNLMKPFVFWGQVNVLAHTLFSERYRKSIIVDKQIFSS